MARESAPQHDCLSDFEFDASALGITTDDAGERRARRAIQSCAQCRTRSEALAAARISYAGHPRALLLERHLIDMVRKRAAARSRPAWWSWPVLAATAGVAAAAVALVVWTTPGDIDTTKGRPGLKGVTAVETFVQRSGRVVRVHVGDQLRPGDALGFRVTTSADTYLALIGTAGGAPIALLPANGGEAAKHIGGQAVDLPVSAVLDAEGESERFAVVTCPAPFRARDAASILAPVLVTSTKSESTRTSLRSTLGSSCDVRFLSFGKRP